MKNQYIWLLDRDGHLEELLQGVISVLLKKNKIAIINPAKKNKYKKTIKCLFLTRKTSKIKKAKFFEKNYKISAFKATENYIYYNDYLNQQRLPVAKLKDRKEILKWYTEAADKVSFWFKKFPPKLIFVEAIDRPESLILLEEAKRILVPCLQFVPLALGSFKFYPAIGMKRKNLLFSLNDCNKTFNQQKPVFKSHQSQYHEWHKKDTNCFTFQKIVKKVFTKFNDLKNLNYYLNIVNNLLKIKYFSKRLPSKYIVFFLSHQPEASVFSEAPEWHDTISIILNIVCSMPSEFHLVVKEHPRSFLKRPQPFYDRVKKLPGVVLLHPSFKNEKILQSAAALLTVTGSIGMEAGRFSIPVGTLGRPFYSKAPWVTELNQPSDAWKILNKKICIRKNKTFLNKIESNSFPYREGISTYREYEYGLDIGIALNIILNLKIPKNIIKKAYNESGE